MRLEHAQRLASEVVRQLRPYCEFIDVAGSIRRQKPEVKDIEIVAIPKVFQSQVSLVGGESTFARSEGFIKVVNSWKPIKGNARDGKYMQREMLLELPSVPEKSIKIDIFTATKDNLGNILLIRTGDSDFSEHMIGTILPKFGYHSRDGVVVNDYGNPISVPTEEKMFALMNFPVVPPHLRTKEYFKRKV